MNGYKRGILCFLHDKSRNLLFITILIVLFCLIVAASILYTSTKSSTDLLKKSVADCVTVKCVEVLQKGGFFTIIDMGKEQVARLVDSSYVDFYNCAKSISIDFTEEYQKIPVTYQNYWMAENSYDGELYAPIYSEYDAAFTVNGYRLVAGRHFTKEDAGNEICLISRRFAELNALQLGDTIGVRNHNREQEKATLTIIGIFEGPQFGEYAEGNGYSPDEMIFTPFETLNQFSARAAGKSVQTISVFMKSQEQIPLYLAEVQQRENVLKIYESPYDYSLAAIPPQAQALSYEELVTFYEENQYINVMLDREWYEMTAEPLEHVVNLCGYLVLGLMAATLVILVLMTVLNVRKRRREFGILLAMGESRANIVLQILIEQFVPMLAAAVLGVVLGVSLGIPLLSSLGENMYQSQATVTQAMNDAKSQEYLASSNMGSGDMGYNHSGNTDLIFKSASRINCMPMISPKLSLPPILAFLLAVLLMTALAVLIQTVWILRLKPARILTGR